MRYTMKHNPIVLPTKTYVEAVTEPLVAMYDEAQLVVDVQQQVPESEVRMPELKKILDLNSCPTRVTLEMLGWLLQREMLPEGPRQEWITVTGVSTLVFSTVMQVRLRRVVVWTPVDGVRMMRTLGVGTEIKESNNKFSS